MTDVHLAQPQLLLLLLALPALGALYARYVSRGRDTILRFSSLGTVKRAMASRGLARRHLPFALGACALALVIAGFADPQLPSARAAGGASVAVALDVSESMAASDYSPTRLAAAKGAVAGLLAGLGPQDHAGIVTFESGAVTASYLTPDRQRTLAALESIPQGSGATAMGDGLALAVDMASSVPGRGGTVVLVSDGVHNSGTVTLEEAAQYAVSRGVTVHTVGLGSEEPVYIRDDVYGEPQYAELDAAALEAVSEATGGVHRVSLDGEALGGILGAIASEIRYETEYSTLRDWLYAGAVALMVANAYVIYGRYRIAA